MTLENGYTMQTTFFMDFSIADVFGRLAVIDTYNRAFKEWKKNYIYLTELVLVLNMKCWQWYERKNSDMSVIYQNLYEKADNYARENLKGEELTHYFKTLD